MDGDAQGQQGDQEWDGGGRGARKGGEQEEKGQGSGGGGRGKEPARAHLRHASH